MITLKKHVLLRFLKIRLIVNGRDIYPLMSNKKVIIPIEKNNPKIVVTDGYHITKPLELVFHHIHTYYFKVVCVIGDFQLGAGLALMLICGTIGVFTGFFFMKVLAFFPILYFLFLYYINRKEFLQIRAT